MSTGEALGLVFALVLVSGALSTLYMTIAGKGYGGRGDGLCRGCPMAIEQGRDFCDECIGGRR